MLSRVADSLYWLGRDLERAEQVARLVEVNLNLMLDQTEGDASARWRRIMNASLCDFEQTQARCEDPYQATDLLAFDTDNEHSIRSCIASARENARQVRENISNDMFEQLNAMHFRMRQTQLADVWGYQPFEFFASIRQGCHLLSGITDASMNHEEAWVFIRLGRAIERVQSTGRLLKQYAGSTVEGRDDGFEADDYLHWVGLLKSCNGFEAYQSSKQGTADPKAILRFLLLHRAFPRSLRFAADEIANSLEQIADLTGSARAVETYRLAGRLQATLRYADIDEVLAAGLDPFVDSVLQHCVKLHARIYRSYISYPIEEVAI